MDNLKPERIDAMRLKDIISQLSDIIYLLCDAKGHDSSVILKQFTNLSDKEYDCLNINRSSNPFSEFK